MNGFWLVLSRRLVFLPDIFKGGSWELGGCNGQKMDKSLNRERIAWHGAWEEMVTLI
jgi:hypothetical protein